MKNWKWPICPDGFRTFCQRGIWKQICFFSRWRSGRGRSHKNLEIFQIGAENRGFRGENKNDRDWNAPRRRPVCIPPAQQPLLNSINFLQAMDDHHVNALCVSLRWLAPGTAEMFWLFLVPPITSSPHNAKTVDLPVNFSTIWLQPLWGGTRSATLTKEPSVRVFHWN